MEKVTILESLDDLLISEIQHLYSTKEQLITLLPKITKKIGDRELRKTFNGLLEEANRQKERLEQIAVKFNLELEGHICKSMYGLVAEADDMMSVETTPDVMDAGLIATAQRIVNFELAGYNTVCNYAYILGYEEVGAILHESLREISDEQETLKNLATGKINERAL